MGSDWSALRNPGPLAYARTSEDDGSAAMAVVNAGWPFSPAPFEASTMASNSAGEAASTT